MTAERGDIQRSLHASLKRMEVGVLDCLPPRLRKMLAEALASRRARSAARALAREEERLRQEKAAKRQAKSMMRQKTTKYGQLNAWEVRRACTHDRTPALRP